jgi:uncharacterized membrane-anchored protein YitT (DUF2179 family)
VYRPEFAIETAPTSIAFWLSKLFRRFKMNRQTGIKTKYLRDYSVITLGSLCVTVSVNLFLANYSLAFGGVTGISILVQELLAIPLNVTYFVLSSALLLWGGFRKGMDFFIKTQFASFPFYSSH